MRIVSATILIAGLTLCASAFGIQRFPPPEFESGYQMPQTEVPVLERQGNWEYVDSSVLFAALCIGTYLVLKKRSRALIFILMVFSLLYFGFWRRGCVCSIGSIGNVALSIFDKSYVLPIGALLFFLLPLFFTLFFGRIFCGAVCPLGAVQDLMAIKLVKVPLAVESALRMIGYLYLALALLFAATGSAFIICRYDPFVSIFRFSGNINMWIVAGSFIITGLFIARPYCRFFCPYGVILRNLSRLSRWRVTITPDECINCRLCEDACPFGAIKEPSVPWPEKEYAKSKKRLALMIVLLPIIVLASAWAGFAVKDTLSRTHATVRLADRIHLEQTGQVSDTTDASNAFRGTGKSVEQLYQEASSVRKQFGIGGLLLGAFLGIVIGGKLIKNSINFRSEDFQADRASCVACGRCFSYCPIQKKKDKKADSNVK